MSGTKSWVAAGRWQQMGFLCPLCRTRQGLQGRKRLLVRGVAQFVCKACVEKKAAAKEAA
jgi:hypothetical protein